MGGTDGEKGRKSRPQAFSRRARISGFIVSSFFFVGRPISSFPLIVFSFYIKRLIDLYKAVEAALGEGDVPFEAGPGAVSLPPVAAAAPGAANRGNDAFEAIRMDVAGFLFGGGKLKGGAQRRTKPAQRQTDRRMQRRLGGRRDDGGGSDKLEGVRPVGVIALRRADAVRVYQSCDAGQRFRNCLLYTSDAADE